MKYKGEYTGMREMRKHVAWYTAGLPHSARLRREVNQLEDYSQLEKLLESLKKIKKGIQTSQVWTEETRRSSKSF